MAEENALDNVQEAGQENMQAGVKPGIEDYRSYLKLLGELQGVLQQLIVTVGAKLAAVHNDDLLALDDCIRQEQAHSLALRSLEQRRGKLLPRLGLEGVPLSRLAEFYPEELKREALEAAKGLRLSYEEYSSASDAAMTALQIGLRQIDRMIEAEREKLGDAAPELPEAPPQGLEPPANMKTDFRA